MEGSSPSQGLKMTACGASLIVPLPVFTSAELEESLACHWSSPVVTPWERKWLLRVSGQEQGTILCPQIEKRSDLQDALETVLARM